VGLAITLRDKSTGLKDQADAAPRSRDIFLESVFDFLQDLSKNR